MRPLRKIEKKIVRLRKRQLKAYLETLFLNHIHYKIILKKVNLDLLRNTLTSILKPKYATTYKQLLKTN